MRSSKRQKNLLKISHLYWHSLNLFWRLVNLCWRLISNVKTSRRFFFNFVAFSENLNFRIVLENFSWICKYWNTILGWLWSHCVCCGPDDHRFVRLIDHKNRRIYAKIPSFNNEQQTRNQDLFKKANDFPYRLD